MNKRLFPLAFCFTLPFTLACFGCGPKVEDDKIDIVCTVFPEYEWTRAIVGENNPSLRVSFLLSSGADMHSFQPTFKDIETISASDLFIYVGGESDAWVKDVLKQAPSQTRSELNLMDAIEPFLVYEEHKEGMEENDEEEEEEAYDEHIWLSLRNASACVDAITTKIIALDNENKDTYQANAASYKERLSSLDSSYKAMVSGKSQKTLLFADRFPFRYLVRDYSLDYYAAFSGCSADAEASISTIAFLANKVDELNLHTILCLESSDQKLANTVKQATKAKNQTIAVLDSMQSMSNRQNKTYLETMQENLSVLEGALE